MDNPYELYTFKLSSIFDRARVRASERGYSIMQMQRKNSWTKKSGWEKRKKILFKKFKRKKRKKAFLYWIEITKLMRSCEQKGVIILIKWLNNFALLFAELFGVWFLNSGFWISKCLFEGNKSVIFALYCEKIIYFSSI